MAISPSIKENAQFFSFIVATLSLLATAYFSYKRMKHDETSRSISASISLIREWRDPRFQATLFFVLNEFKVKYPDPRTYGYSRIPEEKDREMVVQVSHLCDEIGARVIMGEADAEFILLFIGTAICRAADKLRPYIHVEREWAATEGSIANDDKYQGNFLALADKADKTDVTGRAVMKQKKFVSAKF